jgi:hypothetical protein
VDTPLNTLRHRMGVIEGAAVALQLNPILVQYIGTPKVFLLVTEKGKFRARLTPKVHTELYREVTQKLHYLPKCVHTKELDKTWHVELIEWFDGMNFQQLRPFGIAPRLYKQFGQFMKDCDAHGIGIGDCTPGNIFHAWTYDITFQCDVDMFNRTQKHTPVCIKKLLRGATKEQEKAFHDGYR